MSLKVWLPLNGDLENKGCSNIIMINSGVTTNTSGKIGACYYFNASSYLYENTYNWSDFNPSHFSFCCWYKQPSPVASGNSQMICIGTNSGWNNIRIGLLRRTSNGYPLFSVSDGSNAVNYNCTATTFTLDIWNHIACTYDNGTIKIYLNGVLNKTYTTTIIPVLDSSQHLGIGAASNGAEKLTGYLNDVRIYDHTLSAAEVKEISQGLVVHYKLNSPVNTTITNAYNMNSWNTNTASGGFNVWGPSAHAGTRGVNTDRKYIYDISRTYSYYISENEGTNSYYIFYQSPVFEGGYRSLQAIIKEENGLPINSTWCWPSWNANVVGENHAKTNTWTQIIDLGNDFYLCKIDGFYQDGSNDLVSVGVSSGYKIYISEIWLEDNTETCSNVLFPIDKVLDNSGYNNHGIIIGHPKLSKQSLRYNYSTLFDGVNDCIEVPYNKVCPENIFTINLWFKKDALGSKNYETLFGGPSGFEMDTRAGSSSSLSLYMTSTRSGARNSITPLSLGQWYMITMVRDGTKERYYVNGIFQSEIDAKPMPTGTYWIGAWASATGQNYYGLINDFRIYCTPLLDNDIKMLYNTNMSIDNLNNIHSFELNEINGNFQSQVLNLVGTTTPTFDATTNTYTFILPAKTDGATNIFQLYNTNIGTTGKVLQFPWNTAYRFTFDVYSDVACSLYIDYNNYGVNSSLSGNDNDVVGSRLASTFNISANTWTKIIAGAINANETKNSTHQALWDGSTLNRNANESQTIIKIRNIRWYLVDNTHQLYKTGILKDNQFIEREKASFNNKEKCLEASGFIEK